MTKKRVLVKKNKKVNTAEDSISKLNMSGQNIVTVAHNEIQKLLSKSLTGELDSTDIRKLETLTRVVNSQQKHQIDIEKLRIEIDKIEKQKDETHNHLHLSPQQLEGRKKYYDEKEKD